MIRVGIVGATGYVGSELVRWVVGHPSFALASVASTSHAGEPLAAHVPALTGFVDRALDPVDPAALAKLDLVFLATPHGAAKGLAAALVDAPLVVDASSDHRPPHGGGASGWVYGPPELVRERYVGAKRIAAPGCFATAIELAVGPFVKAGAVAGTVCVAAATGSTGSGATPVAAAHHPVRFANLRAYSVGQHRHGPEVLAFLATLAASGEAPALQFVPISAPLDRGIFATCFVPVAPGVDPVAIVADAYAGCPLIRLREGSPEVRHVRGTALADLAVHPRDGLATVLVAIDNIGRGAAAQAVQCANLALGLPEATGLFIPACTP